MNKDTPKYIEIVEWIKNQIYEIRKRKIPILFINSYYPQLKIHHVSINDRMIGRTMTRHLISMGHKKIGGIFKLDDGQGRLRYSGYVEAMSDAGFPIDDSRIIWIDTEDSHNLELLESKIMRRLKDCTGVFCYNNQVAFGLIDIVQRNSVVKVK